jgi:beta-glucosidase-like glycosyl hydrolase
MAMCEVDLISGMCSYDAINGRPSCANDYILKSQLREAWHSPDAFISTDCGAVKNMRGAPGNAPTDEVPQHPPL